MKSYISKKPVPKFLELRLSNVCNLSCLSCFMREQKLPDGNLPLDKWIDIIKQGNDLGIEECQILGGGEALCRKEVAISIMKYIKKLGLRGQIVTNGTLFDKSLIKELVEIEFDRVIISLDGPTKSINDYLRPPNSFNKIINSINCLEETKKIYNKEKPEITIISLINRLNFDYLEDMIKLVGQLGLNNIGFQITMKQNSFFEKLELTPDQKKILPDRIKFLFEVAKKHNVNVNFDDANAQLIKDYRKLFDLGSSKKPFCIFPFLYMGVHESGRVFPCPTAMDYSDNINNHTLEEIWMGETFSNFRLKIWNSFLDVCKKSCCPGTLINNLRLKAHFNI